MLSAVPSIERTMRSRLCSVPGLLANGSKLTIAASGGSRST